ncbi:MAG: hypothetical protein HYT15_03660 [Candidatus Magasanikbacteria bacterium]|nr:hypothetical protein [Candidatus Magasanikbacteria bacterium]
MDKQRFFVLIKRTALVVSIVIILAWVAGLIAVFIVRSLDNSEMKPSKNHTVDYVSPNSRYAVSTLYDENKYPIDIVVIDAKSGVSVTKITPEAEIARYEIAEASSTITFTLYNNKNNPIKFYYFNTKNGEWIK